MASLLDPSRGEPASAAGARHWPAIDYGAYRQEAQRLRPQAGAAIRDALLRAGRVARRGVIAFTDRIRKACDTAGQSRSEIMNPQNLLAAHVPQLLRANDNGAALRRIESA
jgi:hypothetical protein